ncbi:hypothetical protein GWI34_45050 [Actinomadura sp. DSM 109109]|nr:hypothetical protein [Actinomadura lepetitiana]
MVRWLLIAFLIAHGLVHVALWAPQIDPTSAPFDPSHPWLLCDRRLVAQVLAFTAAALLVAAGIALWADAAWWQPIAVAGLGLSTVLLILYYNRWYLFILAINVALIVGIAWLGWPGGPTDA